MGSPGYGPYQTAVDDYFSGLNESDFIRAECLFCGPCATPVFLFKKGVMSVVRCSCGFVYNERQASKASLELFYLNSEAMNQWSQIKSGKIEEEKQRNKFRPAIDYLSDNKVSSVLDIGCGNGEFLSLFKKRSPNAIIQGIETNIHAAKIARGKGIVLYGGSLEQFLNNRFMASRFDCISLWGLVEHLPDPLSTLKSLIPCLSTDGYLCVCVPNVESMVVTQLWEKCSTFTPQHLWYFSLQTITLAMARCGLKVVDHYFVEPETTPWLKYKAGFPPYEPIPDWAKEKYLKDIALHDTKTIWQGHGYKIIVIAKTIGSDQECHAA